MDFIESIHKRSLSTSKGCFAFCLHRYGGDQLPVAISKQLPLQQEVIDPGERRRDLTSGPAECLITLSAPCLCALALCFFPAQPALPTLLSLLRAPLATCYLFL